jgi:crossover junction endodeoxyribonuclease RuvC
LRILGIDPGSIRTGFGIIDYQANNYRYVVSGCIKSDSKDTAGKLKNIYADLMVIIQQYQPVVCGIEEVFVHLNPRGSLKLGQARGVAILACANFSLPVLEYAPRSVKQAVVGYGNADKNQMQQMILSILGLKSALQADAADALGVAICVANSRNWNTQ